MASRKHRRFATTDAHFASLDKLLASIPRPHNPKYVMPVCLPCYDRHTKDEPCEKCDWVVSPSQHSSDESGESGGEIGESQEWTDEQCSQEEAEDGEEGDEDDGGVTDKLDDEDWNGFELEE